MNNVELVTGKGRLAYVHYMNMHTCAPPCMCTCTQSFICTYKNTDIHKIMLPIIMTK